MSIGGCYFVNRPNCFFPAEWYPQSAAQITWPDDRTDWKSDLREVVECYKIIAREISKRQKLIVVCRNRNETELHLEEASGANIILIEAPLNDTWARDHGPIIMICEGKPVLLDFKFNGWGLKYPANFDNLITSSIHASGLLNAAVKYRNHLNFVLEGGSVESDGEGTLLTTSQCLLSPNRNGGFRKEEIEACLKKYLAIDRILWLQADPLAGDDTDGHIDTLARFCSPDSIAYVKCDDVNDEHYLSLKNMEEALKSFRTKSGEPYNLVPLPMADPLLDDRGSRLPATYANFLIVNGAVLVPFYGSRKDETALNALRTVFVDREAVGIDCRALVKQQGSLHCMAMQYPEGVV